MGAMESRITSLTIVYSTVYSDADQKITSKLRVTGLCEGNSQGTGKFPAQMASNAENVSISWRHHVHQHSWCLVSLLDHIGIKVTTHECYGVKINGNSIICSATCLAG